jgi:glycosyltransferase involved in cell wall biosynthesis
MRIAVFHNLPSGGAKRLLFEQVKGLSQKHQIDLYCLNISEEKMFPLKSFCHRVFIFKVIDFKKYGILKFLFRYIQLFQLLLLSLKIAQKINQEKYDLVFLHPCQITHAPYILNFLKIRSVYFAHEPFREAYEPLKGKKSFKEIVNDALLWLYKFLRKCIDRKSIKKASLVLCNSKFTQKNLKEIYGVNAKVIYPGIDLKKFIPLSLNRENAVLSVGRLSPLKGHYFVIEALAKIPRKQRPKLFIVADAGTRKDEKDLGRFASEKEVSLSIFKRINEDNLIRLYNKVKMVICAQVKEPFGFVPLEAMACRTPVLAVSEGGFLETVIDKKTGLFFNRDPEEAAKIIEKLLLDNNLREELTKNGLSQVKKWNIKESIYNLEKEIK